MVPRLVGGFSRHLSRGQVVDEVCVNAEPKDGEVVVKGGDEVNLIPRG